MDHLQTSMEDQESIIYKILLNTRHKTLRQAAKFTSQITRRNFESKLINTAYTCIRDRAGDFQYENEVSDDLVSTGRFTISFGSAHNVCQPGDRSKKDNLKIDVNNNFKAVLAKNMTENGYRKGFAINGFKKCKSKHNN